MTTISVESLSWGHGTNQILEDISFSLEEGDKLGIIGVNGCGKSTLFKLITGEYEPDAGHVFISRGKSVGILTQEGAFEVSTRWGETVLDQMYAAFPELLTMEERIGVLERELKAREADAQSEAYRHLTAEYTELHRRFHAEGGLEFRGRCASILRKMGFDDAMFAQPVSSLSGGQRTRLALSCQLCREPDILMLDEPTNHLDMETLGWLESFLMQYKKNVLVISHDRYFLDRVTNKTLHIVHKHAKLYRGGYTESMEQRRIDREIEERHYRNQQREIARQEAYIEQQRAWNRERNIIAAESRQKALDRMVKLEKPQADPRDIRMHFQKGAESGNDVLTVSHLGMAFGEKVLFRDLSFRLKKGEKAFIIGANGCGKSTLLKLILGSQMAQKGSIEMGYHVEVGYYDQENQHLDPAKSVQEELWSAYPALTETEIRNTLAQFRFVGEDVLKPVAVISGGERARLTLAKLILSRMNLLILDEPTNHLDIGSREALEAALTAYEGTVLIVSHDRYLIDKLATRILEIAPGETYGTDLLDYPVSHPGHGYGEYAAFKESRPQQTAAESAADKTVSEEKQQYLDLKKSRSDTRREEKRRLRLAEEAKTLEAALTALEAELYGDAASDYVRAAELEEKKNEMEERLLAIYEEIGV